MSRDKAQDYRQILENLEKHLRHLEKRMKIFHDPLIYLEIEETRRQIAEVRDILFFDSHPNLKQYRHYIKILHRLISGILLVISILWVNLIVQSFENHVLSMFYIIFSIVASITILYISATYFRDARMRSINDQLRQVILDNSKIFQEIDDQVSLILSEEAQK